MRNMKYFRGVAGVTGTTLAGVLFFFTIIGVFGLSFAIAGLALFVVIAAVTYFAFTGDEVDI